MLTRAIAAALLVLAAPSPRAATSRSTEADPGDLTVHEWGTFTTVAGQDGLAIDWLPLGGPTDLPCFVEHFQNRRDVKIAPNQPTPVDYETARAALWGKVRMETPVLYFYTARATTVGVRVRFPRGLMTEWYPRASVAQRFLDQRSLRAPTWASEIAWPNVRITPDAAPSFPAGDRESHYYAARATDAAPLNVNGQTERFLFYRGVGAFDTPLSATALGDAGVRIRNRDRDALRGVIVFQNRKGAIAYRVVGALRGDTSVALPSTGGSIADLRREIERALVSAGLYPSEATAMVDSWHDSWFEEGVRVFYLVPSRAVDELLPLTITPAPTRVARVFVGRMEVITPGIERSVEDAIIRADTTSLQPYARFLGPISDRILATNPSAKERATIRTTASTMYGSFLRRASSCGG